MASSQGLPQGATREQGIAILKHNVSLREMRLKLLTKQRDAAELTWKADQLEFEPFSGSATTVGMHSEYKVLRLKAAGLNYESTMGFLDINIAQVQAEIEGINAQLKSMESLVVDPTREGVKFQ